MLRWSVRVCWPLFVICCSLQDKIYNYFVVRSESCWSFYATTHHLESEEYFCKDAGRDDDRLALNAPGFDREMCGFGVYFQ